MALTRLQKDFAEHRVTKCETGLSDTKWLEIAGVSKPTADYWRSLPEWQAYVAAREKELEGVSPFARRTYLFVLEEALANYMKLRKSSDNKDKAEARQWWKELATLAGEAKPPVESTDFTSWDDAALEAEISRRELDEVSEVMKKIWANGPVKGGKSWNRSSGSSLDSLLAQDASPQESGSDTESATKPKRA